MALCIGQLHPTTVYRTGLVCALFWCCVSLCVPFTNSLIAYTAQSWWLQLLGILFPWLFIWSYIFRLSETRSCGFCKYAPPWMFLPLDILFEYWIEHVVPSDSFMSCLDSLLGYSTGKFQVLQVIVFVVFVMWIDHLPSVGWSAFGSLIWNTCVFVSLTEWRTTFSCFNYVCIYSLHIS